MQVTLYEIAQEYRHAAQQLAELDLDEQTVADTLESLAGDVETKCKNVAMFVKNLDVQAAAIKEAMGHMKARLEATENRSASVKSYLLNNMLATGITKIECPYFRIAVQDNPGAVVIDDTVPDEYMRHPPAPPPAPDKTAIAALLKAGEVVPWAHIEKSKRLVIK